MSFTFWTVKAAKDSYSVQLRVRDTELIVNVAKDKI